VLLSLPYALALLGWVGGVLCLTLAGLVTFYSYNLLSAVLDHHAQLGQRHLRFRDVASDVLGGFFYILTLLINYRFSPNFFFFPMFKILENEFKTKMNPFSRDKGCLI
jgi:hypothetical protein